ncbi:MAG: hypothetical protein COW63_03480 [Bacteroidetes bacterium CG18_big_fil_WC_8_21_14_2_50_41_14]|nr:MAG: hypothetical protein COW63_03480 [Bacteroidetes bacterium CG18_big_fil_WC_8_21_14_2_50_41_14]PJB55486.1 MAG: hypothetical protein CO098_16185 [Bacteroidetes bacterium CG_4_9_14_3_um_filter_41_19]
MVIGIGGVSNAGKSTLARNLKKVFHEVDVVSLCQDDFAFPTSEIPKINGHTDWECTYSIDFDRFYKEALRQINLHELVILEGIFAFQDERLNKLMDVKLFLALSKEEFLSRKNKDIRWGKEPDWYVEHIWDSHQKYCRQHPFENTIMLQADKSLDAFDVAQKHLKEVYLLKNI